MRKDVPEETATEATKQNLMMCQGGFFDQSNVNDTDAAPAGRGLSHCKDGVCPQTKSDKLNTKLPAHACTAVFANIVEADTNGEIKVEVYPSNQLGSAAEHVQMVRDDLIQATLTSTGALASYYPRIDVLNLAFAFDSNASTYDVFDGPFGETLASDIEGDVTR